MLAVATVIDAPELNTLWHAVGLVPIAASDIEKCTPNWRRTVSEEKPKANITVTQSPNIEQIQQQAKQALDALMQILYREGVQGMCLVVQGFNGGRYDLVTGIVASMEPIRDALSSHCTNIDQAMRAIKVMEELQAKEKDIVTPAKDTDPKTRH